MPFIQEEDLARKSREVMYRTNRSLNIPPGQSPGHLTFLKIIVQIPPSRDKKPFKCPIIGPSVQVIMQMPPPRGNIKSYHVYSVVVF